MEERRISRLRKPKHIIDGLSQGFEAIYKGVEDGVKGLVIQPYEGSKTGVGGFFVGTVKGLAGLVVKPVTGVLDATAKTAEGLTNTATHFDDKPNDQRTRPPRPFYEKLG